MHCCWKINVHVSREVSGSFKRRSIGVALQKIRKVGTAFSFHSLPSHHLLFPSFPFPFPSPFLSVPFLSPSLFHLILHLIWFLRLSPLLPFPLIQLEGLGNSVSSGHPDAFVQYLGSVQGLHTTRVHGPCPRAVNTGDSFANPWSWNPCPRPWTRVSKNDARVHGEHG